MLNRLELKISFYSAAIFNLATSLSCHILVCRKYFFKYVAYVGYQKQLSLPNTISSLFCTFSQYAD